MKKMHLKNKNKKSDINLSELKRWKFPLIFVFKCRKIDMVNKYRLRNMK